MTDNRFTSVRRSDLSAIFSARYPDRSRRSSMTRSLRSRKPATASASDLTTPNPISISSSALTGSIPGFARSFSGPKRSSKNRSAITSRRSRPTATRTATNSFTSATAFRADRSRECRCVTTKHWSYSYSKTNFSTASPPISTAVETRSARSLPRRNGNVRRYRGVGRCRRHLFRSVSQIRMDTWSKGRTALIGDAAACVSLLAGEGTGLAISEGYVLAGELNKCGGNYAAAFARTRRP